MLLSKFPRVLEYRMDFFERSATLGRKEGRSAECEAK
jgi:hypothetical protein